MSKDPTRVAQGRQELEEQLRHATMNRRRLMKGAAGLGAGAVALGAGGV
nr:hypothetical protein [Chloroflexia bacterium]